MATAEGAELGADALHDPRWELARRVADSPSFRNCPKLRAFLLYVCENTVLGQPDNIREQLIGAKVFGRPADYNLREDNIVRVEARELRKRLEAHFTSDGRAEPLVIEIPKGGYIPVFRQVAPLPAVAGLAADAAAPAAVAVKRTPLLLALAVALLLACTAIVWLAVENTRLRQPLPHPSGDRSAAQAADYSCYQDLLGPMWAASPGRETQLVLSNPKVVLVFGTDVPNPPEGSWVQAVPIPKALGDQLGPALNNLDRNMPYRFLTFSPTEYTGMGEAVSAFHLARLFQYLHSPVRLTQGRFLNWDHVHKQNLIVLGSPDINDWTHRNTTASNFNLERAGVTNTAPLPGEPKVFARSQGPQVPSGDGTDYALIKVVNPPYDVRMLVLAGVSSAATAGAGEFFATPEKMKAVRDRIRAAAPSRPFPASWEVVLKVEIRDGFPAETEAVAFRPGPARR